MFKCGKCNRILASKQSLENHRNTKKCKTVGDYTKRLGERVNKLKTIVEEVKVKKTITAIVEPEPEPVRVIVEPEPEPVRVIIEPEPEPVRVIVEPEQVAEPITPEPVIVKIKQKDIETNGLYERLRNVKKVLDLLDNIEFMDFVNKINKILI